MSEAGVSAISEPSTPERVFKVVFVGDSGVGKSSFIHRFCHDAWKPSFTATIGNTSCNAAPRSGQTSRACPFPAKTAPYKVLNFFVIFRLIKPKVKTVTEKLRFIRRLCIGNLIIVVH